MELASSDPKGEPIATPSIYLYNLLAKIKHDSVVACLSKLYKSYILIYYKENNQKRNHC